MAFTKGQSVLADVTLEGLLRELADGGGPAAQRALLCFRARAESDQITIVLEQIAQSEGHGRGAPVMVAVLNDAVLCLCTECPPAAALQFARLVRSRLLRLQTGEQAEDWRLNIGIVAIVGRGKDPQALIDLALETCEAASHKGHTYIQACPQG